MSQLSVTSLLRVEIAYICTWETYQIADALFCTSFLYCARFRLIEERDLRGYDPLR